MALAAGVVEVTAGGTGAVAMEVAAMVVATAAAVMAEAVSYTHLTLPTT